MFPYKIQLLEDDLNKQLLADFKGAEGGFCQVGPQKWLLPASYSKVHAEGYYSMPLRDDDIWIVTYPRSGTTLSQELVWLINNNYDYETASKKSLECRIPFYEFQLLHNEKVHNEIRALNNNHPNTIEQLKIWTEPGYIYGPRMKSPRILKTHLPFSLLPPGLGSTCKVVYVARNPKDVAISYYHHNKYIRLHDYNGDFSKYWEYFEKDLLLWSPFWEHVKEGWSKKNTKNVLFIFYEDLVKDMPTTIKKMASFFEKPITDEQIEKLIDHLRIDNFRKNVLLHKHLPYAKGFMNTKEQHFIRKGKVGSNDEYSEELSLRADQWIKENQLEFKFPIV